MENERLSRLIMPVLRAADEYQRYAYTERILAELRTTGAPGWEQTRTGESRVRLRDALAAARNQPQPLAQAIENIQQRGHLARNMQNIFGDDDEI